MILSPSPRGTAVESSAMLPQAAFHAALAALDLGTKFNPTLLLILFEVYDSTAVILIRV